MKQWQKDLKAGDVVEVNIGDANNPPRKIINVTEDGIIAYDHRYKGVAALFFYPWPCVVKPEIPKAVPGRVYHKIGSLKSGRAFGTEDGKLKERFSGNPFDFDSSKWREVE